MPTPDDPLAPGYYTPGQPTPLVPPILAPVRNFRPPPTTPDYFGRSDQPGSREQHQVSPSDYDKPPPTQTAQAPPTPGNYQPSPQPTPPLAAPPKPPAEPLPPLADWKHNDNVPPWVQPRTHLGPMPNREPDGWSTGRPVYYPRPGESGYDVPRPRGARFTFPEQLSLAQAAGFQGQAAYTAAAIGMAESRGEANQITVKDGGKPYNSYGLMQINGSNDATLAQAGINGAQAALNPLTSYKAAYVLSKGGTDFNPWTTFREGTYRRFLDPNARPQQGAAIAGPVQSYIPPRGREPSQWGEPPDNEWIPGRMPQSHDMPGIMHGLLPLIGTILIGFAGKGALGAITAFSGYQNARNKGQLEAAREQKNLWKDNLSETTSRLKEEMIAAQGVMADYPDASSPQAQMAWRKLAATFDDSQLSAALDSNDMKRVEDLFKRRDSVFQTLSKTSDAANRADAEQTKKDADDREAAKPFEQGAPTAGEHRGAQPAAPTGPDWSMGGGGGGGGGSPAPAAPTAPAAPDEGEPQPQPGEQPPSGAPAPDTGQSPPPADGQPPPQAAPRPPATGPAGVPPAGRGGAPTPSAPPSPAGAPQAPGAEPAAAPPAPAPYGPEVESLAAGFVMGNTDLTGIPKIQQAQVQGRAAQLQNQLNAIPRNLQGQDVVRAVSRINPQMASTLNNLLNYRQGVPQAGETSGGQGGRMLPFWSRMIDLAHQADQTWNPDNYDLYRKSREDFRPGGAMGAPIQRSNKLLASTAAVLDSINEIERKSGGKINETELEAAINALITKGVTGTGEYSGLMGALRNFALESTAVSEAGRPTVTMADAIISAIPPSRTPADIRAFVKKDLWGAVSAIETAHDTWKQLPGNATTEPLGYRDDVFRGLSAVAMTLDPATGNIEGKDLPPVLRSVIPRAAPAPRPGEGGGPTTGGGNGEIIQNGWRYDAKTHQPLGPAQ